MSCLTAPPTRPAHSTIPTVVDKLVESFLNLVVTPIVGMPTYNTLVDRIYQISSNAESMQTTLGSVKLSFLALTITLTVYATLSAIAFTKPVTLDTELYALLQNMDKALKQQVMGGVEDIYLRAPSRRITSDTET